MIALCVGGSLSVWDDLKRAEAMLGDRPRLIVVCNYAGLDYLGRIDAWATLHPELLAHWRRERGARGGNTDCRYIVCNGQSDLAFAEVMGERWRGSSGLYMAQASLDRLGASGVILCGVPIDEDAGHIRQPGPWLRTEVYRKGFLEARGVIGDRVRSMGGWSMNRLGFPDQDWIARAYGEGDAGPVQDGSACGSGC